MRFLYLIIFWSGVYANAQGQAIKKVICNHAWQQNPAASAIWNFDESGRFTAILFWINKKDPGFIAKKGTFTLDDSARIMSVHFDSTYTVYPKDSSGVDKDTRTQQWHLVSILDHKIVVKRPPVWEFESKLLCANCDELVVTLTRRRSAKSKSNTIYPATR